MLISFPTSSPAIAKHLSALRARDAKWESFLAEWPDTGVIAPNGKPVKLSSLQPGQHWPARWAYKLGLADFGPVSEKSNPGELSALVKPASFMNLPLTTASNARSESVSWLFTDSLRSDAPKSARDTLEAQAALEADAARYARSLVGLPSKQWPAGIKLPRTSDKLSLIGFLVSAGLSGKEASKVLAPREPTEAASVPVAKTKLADLPRIVREEVSASPLPFVVGAVAIGAAISFLASRKG